MASGNETTLKELNRRPARPMDPFPELPPRVPLFNLDERDRLGVGGTVHEVGQNDNAVHRWRGVGGFEQMRFLQLVTSAFFGPPPSPLTVHDVKNDGTSKNKRNIFF